MIKVIVDNLTTSLENKYDLFVCSSSFESRSTTIPLQLVCFSFERVILLENKNGSDILKRNANTIKELFPLNRVDIQVDFHNTLRLVEDFSNAIPSRKDGYNILIDVTTFTHEELLICSRILLDNPRISKITCLYNNAADYCSGSPIQEKWLSQGAEMIHPVWGYPGLVLPSKKIHLVVIMGYESSRAFGAISDIEPSSITLIYGSSTSALTEKDKDANSFFKQALQDMAFEYNEVEDADIPCNDPEKIVEGLEMIYQRNRDKNLIVVPLNSKMSTIGVIKFALLHEEIQVCYAPALIYNELNYSSPGRNCYIYELK